MLEMRGSAGHAPGLVAALLLAGAVATAEPVACGDTVASVEVGDAGLVPQVCETVKETAAFLATCGLSVKEPITIIVADDAEGLPPGCFGLFECAAREIRVRTPGAMAAQEGGGGAFAALGPMVLFDSIVAHEWAHAAFEHSACPEARCTSNHEYVAHVAQVNAMPEAARERFLAYHWIKEPVEAQRLNVFMLALSPDRYAVMAWRHFNEPGNGCAFVEALATGAVSLRVVAE